MNETEKDRILTMLAEGTLRPAEAAHLLAALAEEPANDPKVDSAKPKPKQPMVEVQMQRPDGTYYTLQVPPNLAPMLWEMAKVAIKESARNASQEAWAGLKNIVRNKTKEVTSNVKAKVTGSGKSDPTPVRTQEEEEQFEARRRILQMVQNGRITAVDAGRLIQQLDAHTTYQKSHSAVTSTTGK